MSVISCIFSYIFCAHLCFFNLEQIRKKTIHDGKRSVKWLNEIEWIEVDGEAEVRVPTCLSCHSPPTETSTVNHACLHIYLHIVAHMADDD